MIKSQSLGFLNTPSLWSGEEFGIQQFDFPKVSLSEYEPLPIPNNLRLGHQMEYVFKQLVEYSNVYDIVVYNLQIRQEKRTLGEIDFILRDRALDRLIHVELTYKFYLIDPEIERPVHRLIGPNRGDAFFRKKEKIKHVQFPLLHSENGVNALLDMGLDHESLEHQCCFKGQLFQSLGDNHVDIGPLNQDCLAGYWLRFDHFNSTQFSKNLFYIPTKSEWVIAPHGQVNWKSHKEIVREISVAMERKKSLMIWHKRSETDVEKLFVVWW